MDDNHDLQLGHLQGTTSAFSLWSDLEPSAAPWTQINASMRGTSFWWNNIGPHLATLLREARYTWESQVEHLLFFASNIAPELGPAVENNTDLSWRSFITDDGTPVELSWDWGHGNSQPVIRYSIEPIGINAGTAADSSNAFSGLSLFVSLKRKLPDSNLDWFHHFFRTLVDFEGTQSHDHWLNRQDTHRSRIFLALDIKRDASIVLKAYFLPPFKTSHPQHSPLQSIVDSVRTIPGSKEEDFPALKVLDDFLRDSPPGSKHDVEIIAVDCIEPSKARFKVYVRCRNTSFVAVCRTMLLNGRLNDHVTPAALAELGEIWNAVLHEDNNYSVLEDLKSVDHRTSGILYCFEIRKGVELPVPKLYIPVRHYSTNDASVMRGLGRYWCRRGRVFMFEDYARALTQIAGSEQVLESSCGFQTYLGCTVSNGSIKLISYINPMTCSRKAPTTTTIEKDGGEPIENESQSDLLNVETANVKFVPKKISLHEIPDEAGPLVPPKPLAVANGGLRAWLNVLGSFFMMFNTMSILNSFGVFQTYYEGQSLFHASSSQISWIGSVQGCIILLISGFAGPLYDAGYFEHLLIAGTFLVVFGHMMLSICSRYWEVLLAQGFCIGIGIGLMWLISMALMSQYFSSRLGLALGLSATGSSLGSIIYTIVFHRLQALVGFGWATRTLGFIQLVTLTVSIAICRVRIKPSRVRRLIDWTAFKDVPFMLYCIGSFIVLIGLYIPYFYLGFYAIEKGITTPNLGFYLFAIINAGSTVGRFILAAGTDRFGPLNIVAVVTLLAGIIIFCLIAAENTASIIILALLYGAFSGGYMASTGPVCIRLSPNPAVIGTRIGMACVILAPGLVMGTPIGGAILGRNNFTRLWIFSGATVLAGGVVFVVARFFRSGWKLIAKV